ncbi:MAG TPA: UDP-N-acetylglucosamine 1-carboxyvinyltransferase [Exilispira sp.]|nr:UDP-N-acetylglucosamine 1-carboxyvinyltransferase [Exilispira sp.]
MEYFRVKGPTRIKGTFVPNGSKNAALPIIAACFLTDQSITLTNVPEIEDVKVMIEIAKMLGAKVEHPEPHKYIIEAKEIKNSIIDPKLGGLIRTAMLFAPALLLRTGKAVLPKPGGDSIGRRRIDTHFQALSSLGAQIKVNSSFEIEAKKLKGAYIYLDEASVTGTENAIMGAVCADGISIIYNAACEPHVQDLCNFLNSIGAQIEGIGTNKLTITGVKNLKGGSWKIISDHIEVGSIIGLAAITHSEVTIPDIYPEHYHIIKMYYNKLGVDFKFEHNSIVVPANQELTVHADIGEGIPVITDMIWPGFPSDLTSITVVMATQVNGTVLIFEKLFDSRLFFTDKLVACGAKLVLCDPHRVVISGPTKMNPVTVTSPDIRAGMALLIATMLADGESKIYNIRQIDRGYEKIDERLNKLGANIIREDDQCQ